MKNIFTFFLPVLFCCIGFADAGAQVLAEKDTTRSITDTTFVVYIPNAFTPNGETVDYWGIKYNCPVIDHFKVSIYNRWGEVLFESSDPDFHWYGRKNNKGEFYEADTYVYKIKIKPHDLPMKEYMGHFTMIK